MPCTVIYADTNTDNRELKLRAFLHGILETLLAGRNVLCGDCSSLDLVDELKVLGLLIRARIGDNRLNIACNTCKLSASTCLLLVGVVELGPLTDCLAVCNLRSSDSNLAVVLASHSLDIDIKMKLAHTLDNGLVALRVHIALERRVFLHEAVDGLAHIVLALLVLGMNGK